MEQIVNLIVSNGLGVVLVGYFIYKDYKFNDNILSVLSEVKEVLAGLREMHRGDKGE